ncbi:MAG: hypothetical protein IJO93_01530, partial [Clostridia bacterium]|nr:hypothetical protein [Clostridia bacterium]
YTDMGTFWLWENDEGDFEFVNDYIMGVYNPSPNGDSGYAMLIDKEGNVKKTDINCRALKYLSYVSEGLFFAYDGFYDTDGNKVIDLSEYAGRIENRPEFHDGKAEIEVSNPSGVRFHATIDKNGTFLSDFEEG